MKAFLAFPSATSSTYDVAWAYGRALRRLNVQTASFVYSQEIVLQNFAINAFRGTEGKTYDGEAVLLANRLMMGYIATARPDVILVVCGLDFAKATWQWISELRKELRHPYKIALIYTESPYRPSEELEYAQWADYIFTNEKSFVGRLRQFQPRTWYLPQAYDDQRHTPNWDAPHEYGTYFVGSGFLNRIRLLEQVDWEATGSTFTLKGLWPDIDESSPLFKYYTNGIVQNERVVEDYRRSDICLNVHRGEGQIVIYERDEPNYYAREKRSFEIENAYSMNNRTCEIAATGGFQLVDDSRQEVADVFGDSVPTFSMQDPGALQELISFYTQNPELRAKKARDAAGRIEGRTYLANMKRILNQVGG